MSKLLIDEMAIGNETDGFMRYLAKKICSKFFLPKKEERKLKLLERRKYLHIDPDEKLCDCETCTKDSGWNACLDEIKRLNPQLEEWRDGDADNNIKFII